MGFSQTKGRGGVTVVEVDGQLIVGNRHELKDMIQAALDRGERKLLVDVLQRLDVLRQQFQPLEGGVLVLGCQA